MSQTSHNGQGERDDPQRPLIPLGILLVHGIGEQEQGDTLRRFGEPVQQWLESWLRHGQPDPLTQAVRQRDRHLKPGDDEPARIILEADVAEGNRLTWLLAECWWQRTFSAPSRAQAALWMAGLGPGLIGRLVRRQQLRANVLWSAIGKQPELAAGIAGAYMSTYFAYALFFAWLALRIGFALLGAFGMLFVWALVAAAFLPLTLIPGTGAVLGVLQRGISGSLGDTYVLLRSPFSRGAMVERVQRDLDWLEARVDRIVVLAHSQGTVLAHQALVEHPRQCVRRLITVGSPLRMFTAEMLRAELDDPRIDLHLVLPPRSDGSQIEWRDYYAGFDLVPAGPLWDKSTPPYARSERAANLEAVSKT